MKVAVESYEGNFKSIVAYIVLHVLYTFNVDNDIRGRRAAHQTIGKIRHIKEYSALLQVRRIECVEPGKIAHMWKVEFALYDFKRETVTVAEGWKMELPSNIQGSWKVLHG